MASESVNLAYILQLTATEVRSATDLPSANSDQSRTVTHDAFNTSGTLTGSTTQPVSRVAFDDITLGAGTTTIDLTAANTVNGTEDLTGKKVVGAILETGDANAGDVTIAPGATNPYPMFGTGNSIVLGKGRTEAFVHRNIATGLPAVSGTVKTLDITGTSGDTLNVILILG